MVRARDRIGALGLRWSRRSLMGAGAMSVVVFSAFGLSEAHADSNLVISVLVLSVLCVVWAAAGWGGTM